MTQEFEQKPRVIQEEVSTRAIDALMANYRDAQQAFLELIDNAVDNRSEQLPLLIRIRTTKNELSVFNQGGKGLDFEGLKNFFVWGYSDKTAGQIGFYGVGGKAAMGYLGRSMEVICSAKGSEVQYKVYDPSWETRKEGEWKQFETEEERAQAPDGYFRIKITNLKREVTASALAAKLGDIYRPLLLDRSVTISINGKMVEPLDIKYVENDPNLRPETMRVQTRFGDWVELKIGVSEEGQRVKPGIRCYYRGRLIEDEEFFGLPTPAQLPQASRLIGEAHLDFVPVTPNKASFIKSTPQWDNSQTVINRVLAPWMDKLAKLRLEQRSPVEKYEKDLAQEAKRLLEHVFATTGLVTKSMLPGESAGRRPPTQTGSPRGSTQRPGGPGPKEGQTAPVLEATIGQMKRWGALFEWEVVSMGTSIKRGEILEASGKHTLKINSDHPLYQAEKKAGEAALRLYMAETAVLKIAEVITRGNSLEEYVDLVDNLSRDIGSVHQARFKERTGTRGTIQFKQPGQPTR